MERPWLENYPPDVPKTLEPFPEELRPFPVQAQTAGAH